MSESDLVYGDQVSLVTTSRNRESSRFKLCVELPILGFTFGSALTAGITNNLLFNRTCLVDLHYSHQKCELLLSHNKTDEGRRLETEVQEITTYILMIASICSGAMPAVLSLFIGSWSDKHGRKPLLVWPLVGLVITSLMVMAFSEIHTLSSWWYVVCVIPFGLLGGFTTFALGANLHITDTTDDNNRSYRLTLVQACFFTGAVLGSISSSYVYKWLGYTLSLAITSIIYVICLLYTSIGVQESLVTASKGTLTDLFETTYLKEMMDTCCKRRPRNTTAVLMLLISSYGIAMFCFYGIGNIDYLFAREKFQWLLKDYTIFISVNMILSVVGMFLGMALLQSICKMSDGVLLILSYVSSIAEAVVRSVCNKSWHMYLAATVSMFGDISSPMIRSLLTKVVSESEISKVYALLSCTEAVLPMFSPILFNTIYGLTLSVYPGAIFVLSGSLLFVCLVFAIISQCLFRSIQESHGTQIETQSVDSNETVVETM